LYLGGVVSDYWPLPNPVFSGEGDERELQPYPVNVLVSVTESDEPAPWVGVVSGALTETSDDAGNAAKTLVERLLEQLSGDDNEEEEAE
jgi:hypothetical protein